MSRKTKDFRLLGFLGFCSSFIFGAIIFDLIRVLGPASLTELTFLGLSLKGGPELAGFSIAFLGGLWYLSKIFMIPVSTAVSAGISSPQPVSNFIQKCPSVEKNEASFEILNKLLADSGLVVITDNGKPYGIVTRAGLSGKIKPLEEMITRWDRVQKVYPDSPVSELFADFEKYSKLVVVDEAGRPLGYINIKKTLSKIRF